MRSKFKKYKLGTLISEISNRNNRSQIDRVYSVTNSEGFIQSTDYFDKEVFSKDISNYKIVKQYQFAYNPSRINVGSIAYLREQDDVIVSPLYVVFNCTDALIPEYLLKFIKSPVGLTNIKNKTRGSVRETLNYKSLSDIEIPLPTVVEQLKISTILGKIELLIGRRKTSIDLLNDLVKNTFLKMFGDPVRNEKKSLQIRLGELGNWKSGGTPSRTSPNYFKGEIPWVTSGELEHMYIGDSKEKISNEAIKNSNAKIIESGSLLLGMYDTAALKSSISLRPLTCNQAIAYAKLNPKLCNTIYIYFNIQLGKEYFKKERRGVRQQNMNLSMIRDIKIMLPPITEQNQFAAIVENTEALKAQFQSSLSDLEELYASLSQQAFKGELDLSAVEIDETLLPDEQKVKPVITIPPSLQKAIELSNKINKQFEGINRITKIPSALTKQLEQWNELQDQFKSIPKLPQALLQAQENMERIQQAIGINKAGTTKIIVEEEASFNWAVLANRIKERYKNRHFNFEMLYSFIQKDKLAEATPYYSSEELKTNPRLNDAEDLKSFIQTAIQNIEMDEKQQRQTNPFLRLTQSFYNAEEENFALLLHKEDFKLIKDKTARQRSGIYFSLDTEA